MRPRTLLILAGVALALFVFIRFYEHGLPSSDERAQRAKRVLPADLKKDQVTRIRLTAGGATVVLERQPGAAGAGAPAGGGASAASNGAGAGPAGPGGSPPPGGAEGVDWRIVQPAADRARADGAAVDRLLDSLVSLEKSRTLEQAVPAEVGLDKPRAVVALSVAGQAGETVLDVGAAVPTGGEMIVGLSGQPAAYVVSDALFTDLQKKPGDWRDRQLFHGDRDRIERLAWTVGSGPRVVLGKRGDRFWLESPFADRADRDQVEKLLTDLTGLSAERFLDPPAPPPAQLGLAPPQAEIEAVVAGQPQPFKAEFGSSRSAPAPAPTGAPDGGGQPGAPNVTGKLTNAEVGSALVETRSTLAETLARPPADWRSPLLSGLEVHQVEAAVVRDDQGTLPLSRAGTDWKRGPVTISYLPVSDLLFAVTEAKADRLLSPAEAQGLGAGTAKPLLTFELKGGQAGNETLTLYPPLTGATKGVPAKATGRDTVLLLPESKLKDIQDKLQALRTAAPAAPEKPARK